MNCYKVDYKSYSAANYLEQLYTVYVHANSFSEAESLVMKIDKIKSIVRIERLGDSLMSGSKI